MIHVCHVRDMPKEPNERHVYCGRKYNLKGYDLQQSPLSNDQKIDISGNRDRIFAIKAFKERFRVEVFEYNSAIRMEFDRLKQISTTGDLYLYCWCVPKACHCDVIKAELEARI